MNAVKSQNKGFVAKVSVAYDWIQGASQIQLSAFAASSAFFLFVSLVPIILLICSIIPYTNLSQDMVLELFNDYLAQVIPEYVYGLLENIISDIYSGSLLTLSVSAVATIWSAGKSFLALQRGLDAIHRDGIQNYFVARLKACLYTIVMLLAIVFMLLVTVFGNRIVDFITGYFPEIAPPLTWLLNRRWLFSGLGLVLVFLLIYTFVPKRKLKMLSQLPGAVFSTLLWLVFSWLFSAYVSVANPFSAYGSLSTIVVALLWMYYCMYILLLGAYLNVRLEEHRETN